MFTILIILYCISGYSQLGKSKSEIFKNEVGTFTKSSNEGTFTKYSFSGKISKLDGSTCPELVTYFIEDKTSECFAIIYVSCKLAANAYAKFAQTNCVEIGKNKWKDYANNSIYELKIDGNIAVMEHHY